MYGVQTESVYCAVRSESLSLSTGKAPFLGAFAKFRKTTLSIVMFVCSSFRMEQHGCHGTDSHQIWYFNIFRKPVENFW